MYVLQPFTQMAVNVATVLEWLHRRVFPDLLGGGIGTIVMNQITNVLASE